MAASNGIKIVSGSSGISPGFAGKEADDEFHALAAKIFKVLKDDGIESIDTAEIYQGAEEEIGYHNASENFIIDTKIPGGFQAGRKKDEILAGVRASVKKTKAKQFDILYFHAPDTQVPWEEQLEAANELYKEGIYKRLGLSNYTADQVQEVYDLSKSKGWVLPTVYQGNYSAVTRKPETVLLPTLRKLGISYYVYSPITGGFLAKSKQQILDGAGRFDPDTYLGKLYRGLYHKPAYLDTLDKWEKIAEDAGITRAELAYRWVVYHSAIKAEHGDAVIFGARGPEQTHQTIEYCKGGPLPAEIAERVDALWEPISHEAPLDNYHGHEK